jgi:hypothetical protein
MRQVNGWGFKRVVTGSDHNSYYHELFVRDNPQLCLQMKRIKKNDGDDARPGKDDDQDDDDINTDSKAGANADNNAMTMAMANTQPTIPTLPTPSPEDLLKFAGMSNMLPVGMNPGAMVGQPNFMLNSMLPAALLGNPSAAMMNPLTFVTGMPGIPMTPNFTTAVTPTHTNTGLSSYQQPSQSSTPTVPMSNVTTGSSQQQQANASGTGNTTNNNNMLSAFAGVDSATLAKIQEIIAAGGAETLLQQLQQHGQQQSSGSTTNTVSGVIDNVNEASGKTKTEPNNNVDHEVEGEQREGFNNDDNDDGRDDDDEEDEDDDDEDDDDEDDDDDE